MIFFAVIASMLAKLSPGKLDQAGGLSDTLSTVFLWQDQ